MTTLTTIQQLVTTVQHIADTHMEPREVPTSDCQTTIATATALGPLTAHIQGGARIDVRFDGFPAAITAYLAHDGALDLRVRVMPGRAGYATTLLPEDATVEKVTKHIERAIIVMRAQLDERNRQDAEREAERAAYRSERS